ncbi:Capsule polysaccharide export protein [Minicystis rosea]|nr:Capsule polysaccharide export protein [Minicystis rosea]
MTTRPHGHRIDPSRPARCASILLAAIACFALLALGCAPTHVHYDFAAERRAAGTYLIGAGDVLQVRAWKNEALSQRVIVRPDGFVTLPLIGDVRAGGRPVEAIAADIAGRAAKFYTETPVIAVEVAELHGYRVYVLGEVSRPGELAPRGPITVLQAIALAGGFTRFASPNAIVIVRHDARGERRIPISYAEVVEKGDLKQDLPLLTNDTIVVP